jgi:hypothetical protein
MVKTVHSFLHSYFKKRITWCDAEETLASYLGLLGHGNTHKLVKRIE